jgi:anti-sigma factor ChrR (cupin superfamily)
MNAPFSEERASEYLAGLMTSAEAAAFEQDLAAFTDEERSAFTKLSDAAALIVMAATPRRKAPEGARAALMAQAGIAVGVSEQAEPEKFAYVPNDEGWQPLPFAGGRIKVLFVHPQGRHQTWLLELEPGTHLPEHPHAGFEECLILRGDLMNEGRRLGPGDYARAAEGTDHLDVYTEGGCLCIIIASAA